MAKVTKWALQRMNKWSRRNSPSSFKSVAWQHLAFPMKHEVKNMNMYLIQQEQHSYSLPVQSKAHCYNCSCSYILYNLNEKSATASRENNEIKSNAAGEFFLVKHTLLFTVQQCAIYILYTSKGFLIFACVCVSYYVLVINKKGKEIYSI